MKKELTFSSAILCLSVINLALSIFLLLKLNDFEFLVLYQGISKLKIIGFLILFITIISIVTIILSFVKKEKKSWSRKIGILLTLIVLIILLNNNETGYTIYPPLNKIH